MKPQLEHANISVGDIEGAIRFITTALPEFRIRHRGGRKGQDEWVHLGTEDSYLALSESRTVPSKDTAAYGPGLNHIGFVVDDAVKLRSRMLEAGYREGFVPDPHSHRKRVYFHDEDGMEWEFVEYFSKDSAERNSYDI